MDLEDLQVQLNSEVEEFYEDIKEDDKSLKDEKICRRYTASLDFSLLQKLSAVHKDSTSTTSSNSSSQVMRWGSGTEEKGSEFESCTLTHNITMGDSYKRLALRYHTKPRLIKKWNNISKPLKFMIGRELIITAGKDYVPHVPEQTAIQEPFFPVLMSAFLYETKSSELNQTLSSPQEKKYDFKKMLKKLSIGEGWEKTDAELSSRNTVGQPMVASSQRQTHINCSYSSIRCDRQSQIELGPIEPKPRVRFLCNPTFGKGQGKLEKARRALERRKYRNLYSDDN